MSEFGQFKFGQFSVQFIRIGVQLHNTLIRGLFANKIKYPGEILEKVVFDKIGIPECFSKRCDGSTKLLTLTLRNERKTKIIVFPFP